MPRHRPHLHPFNPLSAAFPAGDTDDEGLKSAQLAAIEAGAPSARVYRVDVGDRAQVAAAAAACLADAGKPLDVLVSNAGILTGTRIIDVTDDEVRATVNTNLLSHLWLVKAFLPHMLAGTVTALPMRPLSGDGQAASGASVLAHEAQGIVSGYPSGSGSGHICVISSALANLGSDRVGLYSATKAGTQLLMDSLRVELAKEGFTGVQVHVIHPMHVDTGMTAGVQDQRPLPYPGPLLSPAYVSQRIIESILLGRHMVYIPEVLRIVLVLRAFLPTWALDSINRVLGVHATFDTYRGRVSSTGVGGYQGAARTGAAPDAAAALAREGGALTGVVLPVPQPTSQQTVGEASEQQHRHRGSSPASPSPTNEEESEEDRKAAIAARAASSQLKRLRRSSSAGSIDVLAASALAGHGAGGDIFGSTLTPNKPHRIHFGLGPVLKLASTPHKASPPLSSRLSQSPGQRSDASTASATGTSGTMATAGLQQGAVPTRVRLAASKAYQSSPALAAASRGTSNSSPASVAGMDNSTKATMGGVRRIVPLHHDQE